MHRRVYKVVNFFLIFKKRIRIYLFPFFFSLFSFRLPAMFLYLISLCKDVMRKISHKFIFIDLNKKENPLLKNGKENSMLKLNFRWRLNERRANGFHLQKSLALFSRHNLYQTIEHKTLLWIQPFWKPVQKWKCVSS